MTGPFRRPIAPGMEAGGPPLGRQASPDRLQRAEVRPGAIFDVGVDHGARGFYDVFQDVPHVMIDEQALVDRRRKDFGGA